MAASGSGGDVPGSQANTTRSPEGAATWGVYRGRADGGPAGDPDPESSPAFRQLRDLLDTGKYAEAVRIAYRSAFAATVRAYGLKVPISCTDRRFLEEFLRPDMGRISELMPQMYLLYEPVRFGKVGEGDRTAFRSLLERLFRETPIGRLHDPLYQPNRAETGSGTADRTGEDFAPRRLRESP